MLYNDDHIVLHGISSVHAPEMVFQLLAVEVQSATDAVAPLSPNIQTILDAFPVVFTIPDRLPPKRGCDHAIPLVSGATPVNISAYRYPPQLKDEIESQVQAMLS